MVSILLFRNSSGFLSKFIRWQTDSPYSHAALRFGDSVIESWQGEGVREIPYHYNKNVDEFIIEMSESQADFVEHFARQQLGSGYDYWGCLRFISRRRLPENDKWFCSELVFAAFQFAGVELLERIEPEQVSPGMLSHSPLLRIK